MPGSRGECVSGRRSELISSYLDTMVRSLLLIAALACASAAQVEFSIKGLKGGATGTMIVDLDAAWSPKGRVARVAN